jgi:hypothetical protein
MNVNNIILLIILEWFQLNFKIKFQQHEIEYYFQMRWIYLLISDLFNQNRIRYYNIPKMIKTSWKDALSNFILSWKSLFWYQVYLQNVFMIISQKNKYIC